MSPRSERLTAYRFVTPAVLVLLGVAAYPTVSAVWLSLHRMILVFHERRFIGLANYAFMLHDARFFGALGHTVYFTFVAVVLELCLGLAFAMLMQGPSRGSALLRASVLVPWAIPTVVSAKLWAWMLNPDYGLLTRLLSFGSPINWLGSPLYAMHAAILVDVWKTTPFVALLLLAGLTQVPREVYEAADIDGASRVRTFVAVTLPMLKPTIAVTVIFRMLDAFRVFDAVYVLTEGGPANTTETLSIYAYKTLMRAGDFGYGSALSVVTFGCIMLLCAAYLRLMNRAGSPPR